MRCLLLRPATSGLATIGVCFRKKVIYTYIGRYVSMSPLGKRLSRCSTLFPCFSCPLQT